ncbi:MAG: molybdenum cofactor guanylyltransferase [Deltaproteobacteria bacterium]
MKDINMTGAILAGGRSRRMGFNKAFIKTEGKTIIERTLGILKQGLNIDEVFIVANDIDAYEFLDCRVYSDIIKGAGSMGGIYTALFHSASEHTFIAACDMPLINQKAIQTLSGSIDGKAFAVVPFIQGRFHPLHAIYSKKCLKPIDGLLKKGEKRISTLLSDIKIKKLDERDFNGIPIEDSVRNINTKEDLIGAGLFQAP